MKDVQEDHDRKMSESKTDLNALAALLGKGSPDELTAQDIPESWISIADTTRKR